MICLEFSQEDGDRWDRLSQRYEQMYSDEFTSNYEPYDTDGDGNVSDDENVERPTFINVEFER
jgi:hypothetical protein